MKTISYFRLCYLDSCLRRNDACERNEWFLASIPYPELTLIQIAVQFPLRREVLDKAHFTRDDHSIRRGDVRQIV
jgi:hypothetical protein